MDSLLKIFSERFWDTHIIRLGDSFLSIRTQWISFESKCYQVSLMYTDHLHEHFIETTAEFDLPKSCNLQRNLILFFICNAKYKKYKIYDIADPSFDPESVIKEITEYLEGKDGQPT